MCLSLRRFLRFAPLFVAAVAVHAQTSASVSAGDQANAQPVIKSKVNVVLVDIVVTKGKGEPVPGLRQEDFKVTEEGKAQTISFFEEHKGAPPAAAGSEALPPHVYANDPSIKKADSVNVLLLDWLNTQPQDQPYVRLEIAKYLRSMAPGTRLAIFTLVARLHMVQGFTGDPAELLAALDDKKAGAEPQKSPLLPTTQQTAADQAIVEMMIMNQASPAAVEAVRQETAENGSTRVESRIALTLRALQQLARYLSSIPGRKNVIWFSGSFPVGIFPDAGVPRQYQRDVQQTAGQLTADQVAIYPVAAVGLVGAAGFDPTKGSTTRSERVNIRAGSSDRAADQIAMETLARDTGGHAFYDTNGLTDAMSHAVNDGSHFYTLAYTPTDMKMDGKFRHIQVKVSGRSFKVDYRRGYYAADANTEHAAEQTPEGDALLPLVGFGMPDFAQIVFKARVMPSDPQPAAGAARAGSNTALKGPLTRYGVDFLISAEDLKFDTTPDGVRHGHIELMVVAYDRDGKPLNLVTAKYKVALQPPDYVKAQQQGLQVHAEIDVPAGEVFLRDGVYDLNSHSAGTLGISLSESATAPR